MKESAVTIRDIAKESGVAFCTVARALRNDPKTNAQTILRIQKIAKKMGYTQNSSVSMLMSQLRLSRKSKYVATIAMLHAFPKRNFWRECDAWVRYWEGAKEQAEWRGYKLEEFWLKEPGVTQRRVAEILINRGIRGVLLWPLPNVIGHLNLPWQHFAAVTVGYTMTKPRLSYAATDHFQTTALAIRQLHKLKYKRIGLIIDAPFDSYQGGRVISCYAREAHYHRGHGMVPFIVENYLDPKVDTKALRQWFLHNKPDVIMVISRKYLLHFQDIPKLLKSKIPLCSLDVTDPKSNISGIDPKPKVVGAAAIDLIIEQLHTNRMGPPPTPKAVFIDCEWRKGNTA